MANVLSLDLRRRLVAAVESGTAWLQAATRTLSE
jgi:hypothetical protein